MPDISSKQLFIISQFLISEMKLAAKIEPEEP